MSDKGNDCCCSRSDVCDRGRSLRPSHRDVSGTNSTRDPITDDSVVTALVDVVFVFVRMFCGSEATESGVARRTRADVGQCPHLSLTAGSGSRTPTQSLTDEWLGNGMEG